MEGSESRRRLSDLLRSAANQLEAEFQLSSESNTVSSVSTVHPVEAEVSRLFAPYRGRSANITTRRAAVKRPSSTGSSFTHTFCCLSDHLADIVPAKQTKIDLTIGGLGEQRVTFRGGENDPEYFQNQIELVFPKIKEAGGFELMRIIGTTRNRNLCLIESPSEGYTISCLRKQHAIIGQSIIYIRPLQRSITLESCPSPPNEGPLITCLRCEKQLPFAHMKDHVMQKCNGDDSREVAGTSTRSSSEAAGPSRYMSEATSEVAGPSRYMSEATSEVAGPSRYMSEATSEVAGPSRYMSETAGKSTSNDKVQLQTMMAEEKDWKLESNPKAAAELFKSTLITSNERGSQLVIVLDLNESVEDQEKALLSFYKQKRNDWANPLHCVLRGDVAVGEGVKRFIFSKIISMLQYGIHLNLGNTLITRFFDGVEDHLVPSTSQFLLESEMFVIAGKMMGHSFLHSGPCVAGLSPAIIHMLFDGTPESVVITADDCPDLDIRSTIQLLEGTKELTEEDESAVLDLALSWDLPGVTSNNRRWLYERLLFHAVIERTQRQVKQLRKGLKETMVWPLLTQRVDVVPLLIPRESEALCTPQMVLDKIAWPFYEESDSDDDDDACNLEEKCRITGYLRNFIENASSSDLKLLLKFWVGWEVPRDDLQLQVVKQSLPSSATCFETLRLPNHYIDYVLFEKDLLGCIRSSDTGFGLV